MKKLFALFVSLVILACLVLTASASGTTKLDDNARIIDDAREPSITQRIEKISADNNVNIAVVTSTVDAINAWGETLSEHNLSGYIPYADYADEYYDYLFGRNTDGYLFLIVPDFDAEGDLLYVSTSGECEDIFEYELYSLGSAFRYEYNVENNYADGIMGFFDQSEFIFAEYKEELARKSRFPFGTYLIAALAIGFIVALIVTSVMKGKLKSVKRQTNANSYMRQGSMEVSVAQDIFLFANVTRTPRQTQSSSSGGGGGHTSSGGGHHGGGRI